MMTKVSPVAMGKERTLENGHDRVYGMPMRGPLLALSACLLAESTAAMPIYAASGEVFWGTARAKDGDSLVVGGVPHVWSVALAHDLSSKLA
jgi:hypothetical protein